MTVMDDLIKKLEAATGPDREIDLHIFAVLNRPDPIAKIDWGCIGDRVTYGTGEWEYCADWPMFTFSVDAALTLVPEGWAIHTIHGGQIKDGKQGWAVNICVNGNNMDDLMVEREHLDERPAIAICIAALKARAHG